MAAADDFPARPKRAAFHREAKSPAFAILRSASALRAPFWRMISSQKRYPLLGIMRAGCRAGPTAGFVAIKAAAVAVQKSDGASHERA
jgi:hypothetical protein